MTQNERIAQQLMFIDAEIKEERRAFDGTADAIRELVKDDVNKWWSWVGNYAKDLEKHADRLRELAHERAMLEYLHESEEQGV